MTQILNSILDSARRLAVGRSKVYELIKAGELKTIKIGKRTLLTETELQRYAGSLEDCAPENGGMTDVDG